MIGASTSASLPDQVRAAMEFVFAEQIEEVLIGAIPEISAQIAVPELEPV